MSRKWKLLLANCASAGLLTFFSSLGVTNTFLPGDITWETKLIVSTVNASVLAAISFLTTFRKCLGFDEDENGDRPDEEKKKTKMMALCEFETEHKGMKLPKKKLLSCLAPFAFFI